MLPAVFLMTDSFNTGGSERQFATLARALDPTRFRLSVGCIQKRGGFSDGLAEIVEFPVGGNLYGVRSIQTRVRLARYLAQSRTVVAHAFDFYTNLVLIPAARMARVPVVIGSQRQLGDLLNPAKSRVQRALFRWCDRVVCNSRAAADRLIEQGLPERQLVVIGNGLPSSAFAPIHPALPRRPGLFRVGMLARMNSTSKNHRIFLVTAARLRNRFEDIEFVLVGDGPLRPEFERQASDLGLHNSVRFLGDRSDIPAILASMDVSVLPSASESLSNAILESMAAEVPVVATRVGGNKELLADDRGVLVERDDDQALAAGIERLLRDAPMRAAIGRNARQFAEMNFTVALMRTRHEELYIELLETKTRQPSRSPKSSIPPRAYSARTPSIRVAIVAPTMQYVGGQSVQADLLLANWLNDPDVETRLIPIDPRFPSGLKWAERIPFLRTMIREPIYLLALRRGIKNADIVHIFSASYWSFLIAAAPALLIASATGRKTLLNYHSGEARDHLRKSRPARSLLAKAGQIIVPNGYLVDVFREYGLNAQAVPNIVDLSSFVFRTRRPLRPHLLCTRGFHPYYSIDVVVRAFAEVQKEFPEARLDLVGQGPQEQEIRKLVRKLNLTNVNFAGVASRQEIGRFYDSADIFINASCLDNMPVSIMEAFASGMPVVSTAPEGMRYLIQHERTGLLSQPGDATALARNVVRLLRDSELSLRIASQAHAESRSYCWTEARAKWLAIYNSLAGRDCEVVRGLSVA
jgi:glycosyltransferase involved in cell wall biosynthesis